MADRCDRMQSINSGGKLQRADVFESLFELCLEREALSTAFSDNNRCLPAAKRQLTNFLH